MELAKRLLVQELIREHAIEQDLDSEDLLNAVIEGDEEYFKKHEVDDYTKKFVVGFIRMDNNDLIMTGIANILYKQGV
jgi:hypothetical protein